MKNRNARKRLGAVLSGTLVAGAVLSASSVNATELFSFEDLGSGAELRADLLDASTTGFKSPEAKCGEGKCGEEKSEAKSSEHKCGEGKCGEEKTEMKSSEHKDGESKPEAATKSGDNKVKSSSEGKTKMKKETPK